MLSKAFLLTALLCPSLLAASHNTYAQGTVTYDNPPTSTSPVDNSSTNQDGGITNSNGGYVGHAPNRGLGALMLLNVVPLQ